MLHPAPLRLGASGDDSTRGICGGELGEGERALGGWSRWSFAVLRVRGTASAADFGANDDTGKFAPDGGAAFYAEMASLGLRQTVITVRWRRAIRSRSPTGRCSTSPSRWRAPPG